MERTWIYKQIGFMSCDKNTVHTYINYLEIVSESLHAYWSALHVTFDTDCLSLQCLCCKVRFIGNSELHGINWCKESKRKTVYRVVMWNSMTKITNKCIEIAKLIIINTKYLSFPSILFTPFYFFSNYKPPS